MKQFLGSFTLKFWLIAAGLVLLALGGMYLWITKAEEADDKKNQEAGAKVQREGDLRETIKRTEKANEARNDIRSNRDDSRYRQCLRTARTPKSCQRLLPERETD